MRKPNWFFIVDRKRCPLINSIIVEGLTKHYPEKFPIKYYAYIDGRSYGDETEWDCLFEKFKNEFDDDPEFLLRYMQKAYDDWGKFETYLKSYNNIDWAELSNKEILVHFRKFSDFLLAWNGKYLQFVLLPDKALPVMLREILKKHNLDTQENFLALTSPDRPGFFEQAEMKLREIKSDKDIDAFLHEFSWLANSDFLSVFWNKDHVKARMNDLPEIKKQMHDVEAIISGFDKVENMIVKTVRELVFFRTFRTDIIWKSGWYAQPMFKEISNRIKADIHDLFYFEIIDALEGKLLDIMLLEKRKEGYAIVITDCEIKYYHDNINKLKQEFEVFVEKDGEVEGNVASVGKVTGVVKLISDEKDIPKVKVGDVLVTSMTKPKYIPAMEKAAAFVTDEGGITCHAAIVAREMGKPCVIGTKISTKVFKDGDIVEVDAEKGIVRKV